MSAKKRLYNYSQRIEALLREPKLVFIQSLIIFTVLWWILSAVFGFEQSISSPELVAFELREIISGGGWVEHLTASLLRVGYALVFTVVIGTAIGILVGVSEFWEAALQDYITIGLAFPSIFAVVFAAMLLGITDLTPTVASAVIAFPFLAQNVYEGIKNIDPKLIEMSSSFGVSRYYTIRQVVINSILPQFFSGVRYSFALCWKIVVLSEFVTTTNGLGWVIRSELNAVSLTGVIAWTLLITGVILIVEYGIFQQFEKRMFSWRQSSQLKSV